MLERFEELYVNLTRAPWRRPDRQVRGLVSHGSLVTDIVKARQAAEA